MKSVSGVGVIDKGAQILTALAVGPLDLAGLQDATDLPRATAHRLAVALEAHHLVRRDAQGRFSLGFELIRLGQAAADAFPLADIARPILQALRADTGESVQLYVRDGDQRRCLLSLQSPHALRWIVPEGALLPLGVGSAGKILSGSGSGSGDDSGDVDESVEEREPGVASVSAAVRGRRRELIAAISVSGPVERLSSSPRERFGVQVLAAAASIASLVAN